MTDKPTIHIIEGQDVHARADAVILAAMQAGRGVKVSPYFDEIKRQAFEIIVDAEVGK